MATIYFVSQPMLTPTYEHVIDFADFDAKARYFRNLPSQSYEANIKYDGVRTSVTIQAHIDKFLDKDYLYFSTNDKTYFYFITNKIFETMNTTTFELELDVWNTYSNNFVLDTSFIDRMHVIRWEDGLPTQHTIDEGLEMGDLKQIGDPIKISDFNDSIVVTSTVPLGKVPNVSSGSDSNGGGQPDGECWQEGKASKVGFRFLKGFEGFAPREYQDSGGYWTIGYGTTKHGEPTDYAELASQQPISETLAAKKAYDLLQSKYGLKILDAVKGLGCNNQAQFDALLSVAYNSGTGSITGSNSLTQAIAKNPKDEATIRPIWEKFKVTSNGIPLEGLRLRRIQECNMYFGKDVEMRSISIVNTSGGISGTMTENNGDGWLPDT